MPDFIPRQDELALAWSAHFAGRLAADPAHYHVGAVDAALLAARQADFAEALERARALGTNSTVARCAKQAARRAFEAVARRVAVRVRGVFVNDRATLVDLGLAQGPGRTAPRRKIGPPQSAPLVFVAEVLGARVGIHLHNPDAPSRRGLARDVAGAVLFTSVGDEPPARLEDWRMHAMTSRAEATLEFGPGHRPGTRVWIVAQWMNRKSQSGPVGRPASADLGYGGAARAAA